MVLTTQDVEKVKKKKRGTPSENLKLAYAASRGDTHEEEKILAEREGAGLDPIGKTLTPEEEAAAMELPKKETPTTPQQTTIMQDEKGSNIIGQGLLNSPLGQLQQATGIPLFDTKTPDVQRLGKTAAVTAGALAAPLLTTTGITGSLLSVTSKIPILGKLGQLGAGMLTGLALGEAKDFITGEDSRTLANEYDSALKNIIAGVKLGSIDTYEAQTEINKYVSQLNELEGSFHTGLKQLTAETDSGRRFIENIKNAQRTGVNVQFELQNFIAEQQQLRREVASFSK